MTEENETSQIVDEEIKQKNSNTENSYFMDKMESFGEDIDNLYRQIEKIQIENKIITEDVKAKLESLEREFRDVEKDTKKVKNKINIKRLNKFLKENCILIFFILSLLYSLLYILNYFKVFNFKLFNNLIVNIFFCLLVLILSCLIDKKMNKNQKTIGLGWILVLLAVIVIIFILGFSGYYNIDKMTVFFSIVVGIGVNALFDGIDKYEDDDNLKNIFLQCKIFFNTLYVIICLSLLFNNPVLSVFIGLLIVFLYNLVKHLEKVKENLLFLITYLTILIAILLVTISINNQFFNSNTNKEYVNKISKLSTKDHSSFEKFLKILNNDSDKEEDKVPQQNSKLDSEIKKLPNSAITVTDVTESYSKLNFKDKKIAEEFIDYLVSKEVKR
ncbi:hypothetical protein [Streptococcus ruminicola]|uniref:hypothetical protein n=1 Tax=Streptococcus ruminicola TaxID=2686210 RepID=UPI002413FE58|nr:hypothetical protein [Streptococcus ruminicola]WFM82206.1 hypothetical protein P7Y79_02610 [Streptococcus ruminicola]